MAVPFQYASSSVNNATTSRAYAVTAATAAGDTLLVFVNCNQTSLTISAVTDSGGNVYTLDTSSVASTPIYYCFRSPGLTGGPGGGPTAALTTSSTITVTTAAVSGATAVLGIDAGPVALDTRGAISAGSGATTVSPGVTPASTGDLMVAAGSLGATATAPAASAPYTAITITQVGGQPWSLSSYNQLGAGVGGAQTATFTWTTAVNFKGILYSFTPLAALLPQQLAGRHLAMRATSYAPAYR